MSNYIGLIRFDSRPISYQGSRDRINVLWIQVNERSDKVHGVKIRLMSWAPVRNSALVKMYWEGRRAQFPKGKN